MDRAATIAILLLTAGLTGCLSDGGDGGNRTVGNGTAGDEVRANGSTEQDRSSPAEGNQTTEPEEPDPSRDATPSKLVKFGCRETFASTEAPASWAREQVPEGFEPIPNPALGDSDAGESAWFAMVSAHCEETRIGNTSVDAAHSLWYAIAVDPPDAYENGAAYVHFYPLQIVVGNQTQLDHLQAWGLPAETGNFQLERTADEEGAWAWGLQVESPEATYTLDARASGSTDFHDPTVRLIAVDDEHNTTALVDLTPQGNTRVSSTGSFTYQLEAPDAPATGTGHATSPFSNVKVTPSGQPSLLWERASP